MRWRDYVLESLVRPNIEMDILAMQRVDKPALLKNCFELGCLYSGQELSLNKMKGQLQDAGNETTLAHYLDLLAQAGLLTGLQKYAGDQARRRKSPPKLVALNAAHVSVYAGYTFEEAKSDRTHWGRLVETAAGSHLVNGSYGAGSVYYWRQHAPSSNEVDFILVRGQRIIALEIKTRAGSSGHSGLLAFGDEFTPERSVLVSSQPEEGNMLLADLLSNSVDSLFSG